MLYPLSLAKIAKIEGRCVSSACIETKGLSSTISSFALIASSVQTKAVNNKIHKTLFNLIATMMYIIVTSAQIFFEKK